MIPDATSGGASASILSDGRQDDAETDNEKCDKADATEYTRRPTVMYMHTVAAR